MARRAVLFCDRALAFAEPRGPWDALRDWWRWRLGELEQPPVLPRDAARETSARACFQWGLLAMLRHDRRLTLAWLERARFLQPDNYWHQYALAYHLEQAGEVDGALQHYEAAVALRPAAPWAWFNRAHLYAYRKGAWSLALRDLDLAVTAAGDLPADRARFRIERGKVRQAVGDMLGARADFEAAIAADPVGPARPRRSDRPGSALCRGRRPRRARAEYDALLDADPSDRTARLARARLAMRQGRAAEAEADLTRLLSEGTDLAPKARADWLASRALARLALGRAAEAEADAEEALRLDRSPSRARIRARVALARVVRSTTACSIPTRSPTGRSAGRPSWPTSARRSIGSGRRDRPGGTDRRRGASCPCRDAQCPGRSTPPRSPRRIGPSIEPRQSVVCPPRARSDSVRATVPGPWPTSSAAWPATAMTPSLLALRGRLAIEAGKPGRGPPLARSGRLSRRSRSGPLVASPGADGPGSSRGSR